MERCYFEYCLGKTKDETLNEAIIHKRDIISTITEEMLADQGYDPAILLQLYKKADELERAIMNKSSCLKKPVFMRVSAISISLLITN